MKLRLLEPAVNGWPSQLSLIYSQGLQVQSTMQTCVCLWIMFIFIHPLIEWLKNSNISVIYRIYIDFSDIHQIYLIFNIFDDIFRIYLDFKNNFFLYYQKKLFFNPNIFYIYCKYSASNIFIYFHIIRSLVFLFLPLCFYLLIKFLFKTWKITIW